MLHNRRAPVEVDRLKGRDLPVIFTNRTYEYLLGTYEMNVKIIILKLSAEMVRKMRFSSLIPR